VEALLQDLGTAVVLGERSAAVAKQPVEAHHLLVRPLPCVVPREDALAVRERVLIVTLGFIVAHEPA